MRFYLEFTILISSLFQGVCTGGEYNFLTVLILTEMAGLGSLNDVVVVNSIHNLSQSGYKISDSKSTYTLWSRRNIGSV